MTWIIKNKRNLRTAIFLVSFLALTSGPWVLDRVWVPGEFDCTPPSIRLDENFCGLPLSGITFFIWWIGGVVNSSISMVTSSTAFLTWLREGLLPLIFLFPLFAVLSTILLILLGEKQWLKNVNITIWGISLGICIWLGTQNHPSFFYVVWGLWLFIGLSLITLILESWIFKIQSTAADQVISS